MAFYRDLSHYLSHHSKHPAANRDTLGWRPASFRHAAANRDTLRGKTVAGHLNLRPPAFDTQRPIGTRCAERLRRAHVGMFLPTFLAGHFWPPVFCRPFLAGIFARRAHKGAIKFFASVSPFEKGRGGCWWSGGGEGGSDAPLGRILVSLGWELLRRSAALWGAMGATGGLGKLSIN